MFKRLSNVVLKTSENDEVVVTGDANIEAKENYLDEESETKEKLSVEEHTKKYGFEAGLFRSIRM